MFSFGILKLRLSVNDFWSLTPLEMTILIDFFLDETKNQQKKEMADTITQSWYTANFSNAKKLPNLKKMLKDIFKKENKQTNKMNEDEMKNHYNKKVVK